MEFPFDVVAVLGERVSVVDQHLRPAGRRGPAHRYRAVGLGLRLRPGLGPPGACWEKKGGGGAGACWERSHGAGRLMGGGCGACWEGWGPLGLPRSIVGKVEARWPRPEAFWEGLRPCWPHPGALWDGWRPLGLTPVHAGKVRGLLASPQGILGRMEAPIGPP